MIFNISKHSAKRYFYKQPYVLESKKFIFLIIKTLCLFYSEFTEVVVFLFFNVTLDKTDANLKRDLPTDSLLEHINAHFVHAFIVILSGVNFNV